MTCGLSWMSLSALFNSIPRLSTAKVGSASRQPLSSAESTATRDVPMVPMYYMLYVASDLRIGVTLLLTLSSSPSHPACCHGDLSHPGDS